MTVDLQLPEVMPLVDAAERLGVSVRTLERARDGGELACSQLAERGCWVVLRDDLLAWITMRRVSATPITPMTGASRGAARVGVEVRRRGRHRGPLEITEDMGRAA